MNNKFKIGDKVKLVVPSGCKLVQGGHVMTGFRGGITSNMLKTIEKHNGIFTIESILCDNKFFIEEDAYFWDGNWFEKLSEAELNRMLDVETFINTDISIKGDRTRVEIDGNIGVSRKSKEDEFDVKIGILIAMARALKLEKHKVDQIIDVLYDDIKRLKDYSTREIQGELLRREIEE